MKRILRLCFLLIAPFLMLALFLAPNTSADPTNKQDLAQQACAAFNPNAVDANTNDKQTPKSTLQHEFTACQNGFKAALNKGAAKPENSKPYGPCYTSSSLYKGNQDLAGACQAGYIYAYNNKASINKLPDQPSLQQQQQTALEAKASSACSPNVPGADNQAEMMQACTAGYEGAANGKSLNTACQDYSSGIDNQMCSTGYNLQGNGQSSGGNTPDTDCEAAGGPFGWALCPIYTGLQNAEHWALNDLILPLLKVNPVCTDANGCSQTNNVTYSVWSNFRIYADIFLVIALLVVVFGEGIGGGMIDAYTAKKVLPRLLLAAILINLSIYIIAFLVDVFNVIGGGIGALITAPLAGSSALKIHISGGSVAAIDGSSIVLLGVGGLALVGATVGVILGLVGILITGALALLGVFITLIIRQAIIMALLFVSPVAFALWCLPNTERWFKRWWDILFQMLIAYPLIIILFAVAGVMSAIVGSQSTNVLNAIVAFAFVVIPLFLVPMTLRMAGGVMGQLQGAMSNMARMANRYTGRRVLQASGKEFQSRAQDAAHGKFFKGGTKGNWRGRFNEKFQYAATASNLRNLNGPPSRWHGSIRSAMANKHINDVAKMMEDEDYTWKQDDTVNKAASESSNGAEFQEWLRRNAPERYQRLRDSGELGNLTASVERMRHKGYSAETFRMATTLNGIAGGTANDTGEFVEAIAKASGGDEAMRGFMVGQGRSLAMKGGQVAQGAASFGTVMNAAADISDKIAAGMSGPELDAAVREAGDTVAESAFQSSAASQAFYGKPSSVEELANAHSRIIDQRARRVRETFHGPVAVHEQAKRDLETAIKNVSNMKSSAGYQASPQNAEIYDRILDSHIINDGSPEDQRVSVSSMVEEQKRKQGSQQNTEGHEEQMQAEIAQRMRESGGQPSAPEGPPRPPMGLQ